jgi:hypothetical protein
VRTERSDSAELYARFGHHYLMLYSAGAPRTSSSLMTQIWVSSQPSALVMTGQAPAQPGTWTTSRSSQCPTHGPTAPLPTAPIAAAPRSGRQRAARSSILGAACQPATHSAACGCHWVLCSSSCGRAAAAGAAARRLSARAGRG